MKKRRFVRLEAELLPKDLMKISLVLPDKLEIESCVVDISPQGLRVSISPSVIPLSVPQINETVGVVFQAIQLQLTCRCIYSMYNQDGSMLMGFYVFDPNEQSKLRELLDRIE
jgi:hypothetical protein